MQKEILKFVLKKKMEKTNKNKSRNLSDFLRYHKNEMSGEERNSFERDLQKDPFAEEASEGFSLITSDEAEKDLSAIKRKLERKTGKRSPVIYYRLAAAVAVLVTISVIFFNNRNMNEETTLSKNSTEEVKAPLTIAEAEPLKDKTESPNLPVSPSPPPAARAEAEKKEAVYEVTDIDEITADQMMTKDSVTLKIDLLAASAVEDDDANPEEEVKKMSDARVTGVALKEEAQAPLSARSKSAPDIVSPEPVTGLDSFNIWIEKNIHDPDPDNNLEEAVIISFIVMKDSTIRNIKIISSPGEAFSREAKRLINEGPLWKPAMIDGKPLEKEHRLTIRF